VVYTTCTHVFVDVSLTPGRCCNRYLPTMPPEGRVDLTDHHPSVVRRKGQ
jgi:hypothetical protein